MWRSIAFLPKAAETTRILHILTLFVAGALAGCWIPEQFEAKVAVNGDGGYSYSYDGVLAFAPAVADHKRGVLNAGAEAELAKLAPELRREGFRKADYLGRGRFSVSLEKSVPKGQASYFLSKEMQIFYIQPQQDNIIVIGAFRPDAKTLNALKEIDAKVDGTLVVSLPHGARVVKHNAQTEPWLYGWVGSYKWQIKDADANPFMIIQMGQ